MKFHILQWVQTFANKTMEPRSTGPVLGVRGPRYGNDALTNSAGGWQGWPENAEVLEELDFPDWDAAELYFYQNYRAPQPSELKVSAGWVSPTGVFFACRPEGHDGLATAITARQWHSLNGVRLLEEYGWLRLYKDGALLSERIPNEAQRATLKSLSELDDGDATWRRRLLDAAESDWR